jgi:hypothetical protein
MNKFLFWVAAACFGLAPLLLIAGFLALLAYFPMVALSLLFLLIALILGACIKGDDL